MPKVLIVDDSLSVRRALERVLSAKDFEVVAARSGEEALERFAAVSPDLTIADVIMPGIGGFELCRKLRERSPETPVILISGVGDAQIEQQARAVGAAAIIPKPFSPEDLSAALGAALNPPEPQLESKPEPEAAGSAELPDKDLETDSSTDSATELPDADYSAPNADPYDADLQGIEAQTVLRDSDLQSSSPQFDPQDSESQDPEPQGSDLQGSDPQESDMQFDPQESGPQDSDSQLSPQDSASYDLQDSGLQNASSEGELPDAEPQGELQSADSAESVPTEPSPVEPAPPEPAVKPAVQSAVKPDLTASLKRFLEKPEVLAATLSDRQGACLVHVGEYPSDAEALASYSRFLLVASDVLGTHYGADQTNGMVLEFPRYALYLGRVDDEHILSLHLSDAKALSVVRYLMNRTLPELASELRGLPA